MTREINLLCKVIVTMFAFSQTPVAQAAERELVSPTSKRLEIKADRLFIRGEYPRAMRTYEQADGKLPGESRQKRALELKMARLYNLLQQTDQAISYYDAVYGQADTLLTVNDVCFFLDALRQRGENQQAEIVARNYAFKSPYSRNQRYMNTLYALSNQHHYYNKGDSDYAVARLDKSGPLAEYWVGQLGGKPFYALSHSQLQDPLKVFYHRTQYFSLNDESLMPFRSIPRELQSGPVAFSDDNRIMAATGICYRNSGRILTPGQDRSMYVTQLYYSFLNPKSGGWHRFIPLFEQQQGYSYAHPTFFNGGKSLIFASDRPGGHGGMDLYVTDWNEAQQRWSDPVNLGKEVNTEGDEIYPQLIGNQLYFSSNGHEGFGGYDIYRMVFEDRAVVPGTLFHYSYPINSAHNDFGASIDGETGYFISDRRGAPGKDDIYTFDAASTALGRDDFIGVSQQQSAMTGQLNVIAGLQASHTGLNEQEVTLMPDYRIPQPGEVLLSVYFDFNRHDIDPPSAARLEELLSDAGTRHIGRLEVIGYADEFGSESYNQTLSEQRAEAVAQLLRAGGIPAKLTVEGRGKLYLPAEEYRTPWPTNHMPVRAHTEINGRPNKHLLEERIRINQKVRRVDLIVKEMQMKP